MKDQIAEVEIDVTFEELEAIWRDRMQRFGDVLAETDEGEPR